MISLVLGPAATETLVYQGSLSSFRLDDSDDSIGLVLQIPASGIITKVGLSVASIGGNPPTYNFGLTTLDSSGHPSTTAYGGSSPAVVDFTSVGWKWVDLTTSATASRGDFMAIYIWPNGTPNGADYVSVNSYPILDMGFPSGHSWTTVWNVADGPNSFAFQYNDGTIVGYPVVSGIGDYFSSTTTPDEIGCKFTLPIDVTCVGARFQIEDVFANANIDVVLYDSGGSVLASTNIDDTSSTNGIGIMDIIFDDDVSLSADTTYRLTLKPTTSDSIQLMISSFPSATERSCSIFESSRWYETYRTDGGSWTDNELAIPWMGLLVSSIATSGGNGGNGGGGGSSEWGFVG